MTAAFVDVGVHFFFLQQHSHAIGELEFAAGAGGRIGQAIKNGGREDVAADDSEVGRGIFGLRFLDHVLDLEQAAVESIGGPGIEDAIGRNHFSFDDLRGNHRALFLLEDICHLFKSGHGIVNHVIGEEHGERLVADEFAGHEHGVSQTQRLFLADIGDMHHVGNGPHNGQQLRLLAGFEHVFEFITDIEMVFDGLLAASGDDDDLVAAGGHGFFDAILNDGLVHQGEHFLGLGFGGGQEASAEAGGGEYGFADFHSHRKIVDR